MCGYVGEKIDLAESYETEGNDTNSSLELDVRSENVLRKKFN